MIIQTLHGFVVTDVIFGVVSIVVIGLCDITAYLSGAFAEFCSPLRRSINAAKSSAPAEGAGKRGVMRLLYLLESLNSIRLALDGSIARRETAC